MDAAEDCTGKQRSDKKRDAGFYESFPGESFLLVLKIPP